ncbi:MAG: CHAD domain-containing protein [Alkalibacterium sp.]|nr:CHAD domain-containing protein [Alkalibacterium sp.]
MSLELLLIRHGKAEKRSADKDDTKRKLTSKGKEAFEAFINAMKADLKTDGEIVIWTSPLKRAVQTADIVSDQMEWSQPDKKDFIATGDFTALMDELSDLSSGTRVVCVGHEPTLGNWVEELTGSEYSFKKGGMVLLELTEGDHHKGTLVWAGDPKSKKKSDEETEVLRAVLTDQLAAMRKAYTHFRNNPYSPKRTHRFRVTMRKMRSLLHFVKHLIGTDTYDEFNELLKDAAQRLEPIREADVLIESCGERALEEPGLIDNYAEVFRYLHNDRRKWMRRRLTESMVSAFEEMLTETEERISRLTFDDDKQTDGKWDAYLHDRFTSRKKKVLKAFKKADHSDHEAAHDVRKQAKKLRYAAKGYKEILPSKEVKKTKKKLKSIQNELGLICDLYTNSEKLTAYSEKAKEKPLKQAFSLLAERQIALRDEVISKHSELNDS